MALKRGIFVVGGYGQGAGTGSAAAVAFSKAGYKVALIARGADALERGAADLKAQGGDAAAFPVKAYDNDNIHTVFEEIKKKWPNEHIRVALWNAGFAVWKGFLDITPAEWQESADTNIVASAAFARESILAFKDLDLTPEGARGTLLFTGATASIRGNKTTSAFAAGKHALRALSQSLGKEFGKQNIHVAHAIIDGPIKTERSLALRGGEDGEFAKNADVRLTPEGIAEAYIFLAHQPRSTWTWELDLRPAHENW